MKEIERKYLTGLIASLDQSNFPIEHTNAVSEYMKYCFGMPNGLFFNILVTSLLVSEVKIEQLDLSSYEKDSYHHAVQDVLIRLESFGQTIDDSSVEGDKE